jgi:hypothetical protein
VPADCPNSPRGLAMVHNSSTHVLFALDKGAVRPATEAFDLTPTEKALLERALPGEALVILCRAKHSCPPAYVETTAMTPLCCSDSLLLFVTIRISCCGKCQYPREILRARFSDAVQSESGVDDCLKQFAERHVQRTNAAPQALLRKRVRRSTGAFRSI